MNETHSFHLSAEAKDPEIANCHMRLELAAVANSAASSVSKKRLSRGCRNSLAMYLQLRPM